MRVSVGKALRVGPGDEVHAVARLRAEATLGRLFVFAKEGHNDFSPYAPMIDVIGAWRRRSAAVMPRNSAATVPIW